MTPCDHCQERSRAARACKASRKEAPQQNKEIGSVEGEKPQEYHARALTEAKSHNAHRARLNLLLGSNEPSQARLRFTTCVGTCQDPDLQIKSEGVSLRTRRVEIQTLLPAYDYSNYTTTTTTTAAAAAATAIYTALIQDIPGNTCRNFYDVSCDSM